jgi:hypothetical protein
VIIQVFKVAANTNMIAVWDIVLCSLIEVDPHHEGSEALMVEAACISETSVYFSEAYGAISQKAIILRLNHVHTPKHAGKYLTYTTTECSDFIGIRIT